VEITKPAHRVDLSCSQEGGPQKVIPKIKLATDNAQKINCIRNQRRVSQADKPKRAKRIEKMTKKPSQAPAQLSTVRRKT